LGRPRIPSAIKKAKGNPGRRPIPKEPKSERVIPTMPNYKNAETKAEWKRDTPEFYKAGLITKLTAGAWLWMFKRIDQAYTLEKELEQNKSAGFDTASIQRLLDKAWQDVKAARCGFGGDPSSLSKVFAGTKEEEENPFSTFEVVPGGRK
jgi:phage terminase small subunit